VKEATLPAKEEENKRLFVVDVLPEVKNP